MKTREGLSVWDELESYRILEAQGGRAGLVEEAIARGRALERVAEAARALANERHESWDDTVAKFKAVADALAALDEGEG